MVKINENLIINESYIVKAEFSKTDTEQILTWLLAVGDSHSDPSGHELVVKDREA